MAKSSKIRVMISSRCNDVFPAGGHTLSQIRTVLKTEIEAAQVFGRAAYETWINEAAPPMGGTWNSWDVCLNAVRDCDILLVLCNGNAGWANAAGDIGICHAELMTGLSEAPGKVWLISLGNIPVDNSPEGQRNQRFQDYVNTQSLFRGGAVGTEADLRQRVQEALHEAIVSLVQRGVREANKGRFHSGQALDWSRLDFAGRQQAMRATLRDAMLRRTGSQDDNGALFVKMRNVDVLVVPHAIPAAFGIGAAREMVGQPFLKDYTFASSLTGRRGGPVHVIACHKTATESQALKVLGFPDATVVAAPFGIYVADQVQKVQFVFLANCRDESNTRHGVQRFFEWLEQTDEELLLAKRARSRTKIIKTIAGEYP